MCSCGTYRAFCLFVCTGDRYSQEPRSRGMYYDEDERGPVRSTYSDDRDDKTDPEPSPSPEPVTQEPKYAL